MKTVIDFYSVTRRKTLTIRQKKISDFEGKLLKQLLSESGGLQALLNNDGLLEQLKKRLIETALDGELDEHLGKPKHEPSLPKSDNSRNGYGSKTIIVDQEQFESTLRVTATAVSSRN